MYIRMEQLIRNWTTIRHGRRLAAMFIIDIARSEEKIISGFSRVASVLSMSLIEAQDSTALRIMKYIPDREHRGTVFQWIVMYHWDCALENLNRRIRNNFHLFRNPRNLQQGNSGKPKIRISWELCGSSGNLGDTNSFFFILFFGFHG